MIKKMIALLLIITMFVPTSHVSAFAVEKVSQADSDEKNLKVAMGEVDAHEHIKNVTEESSGVKELPEKRTENSTTWLMPDGSMKTEFYSAPVRYESEQGLIDYDLSLSRIHKNAALLSSESDNAVESLSGYAYVTTDSDCTTVLPEEISEDTPIILDDGTHMLELVPLLEGTASVENGFSGGLSFVSAETETEKVTDLYGETSLKNTNVIYESSDGSCTLTYASLEQGMKESLILNRCPAVNQWKFVFSLEEGITAILNEVSGSVCFVDANGNSIGGIHTPEMNDATGEHYSTDINYYLESSSEAGSYILTMEVSRNYLDSSDTVYPVTIDPTYSWQGSTDIQDVYVLGKSTYNGLNFYEPGITCMFAGKTNANGTERTYLKFKNLASRVQGYSITSAKLTVYETGGTTAGETVQARRVLGSWNPTTITWNNRPSYGTAVQDSFISTGTTDHKAVLDITPYVRRVENGDEDYGILLKTETEEAGKYVKMYGSRHSSSSKRPKLVVTYIDKPTVAEKITLDDKWLSSGEKLGITWKGIVSPSLDIVQYRIASVDDDGITAVDTNYIPYSTDRYLGTTRDGSRQLNVASYHEGWFRINVRGMDTNGEVGPNKYLSFLIDRTAPILSEVSTRPIATASTSYTNNGTPVLRWTASDRFFSKVQYSVDEGVWKTAGTSLTGSFTLPSGSISTTGLHKIRVRAVDKCGNFSAVRNVNYYYDKTLPQGSITVRDGNLDREEYVVSVTASDTGSGLGSVTMYVTDQQTDTEYILFSGNSGREVLVNGRDFQNGNYELKLVITDKAGNSKTVTKLFRYVALRDWNISSLTTGEANDGRATIFFNCPAMTNTQDGESAGNLLPEQVSFQIARGTSASFTASASNIVAENVRSFYWIDMETGNQSVHYYKVRPVRRDSEGNITQSGNWSASVSASSVARNGLEAYTGIKEYLGYVEFDTPTGYGKSELSHGNLYFEQTDAAIESGDWEIGVTRYYNSLLTTKTSLGKGWRHCYDVSLYKNGNGSASSYTFREADGTEYIICNTADGYVSEIDCAYRMEIASAEEYLELNNGIYRIPWKYCIIDKEDTRRYFSQSGQLMAISTPDDSWQVLRYDALTGRLMETETDTCSRTEFFYEMEGEGSYRALRLVKVLLSDGTEENYTYDRYGRITGTERRAQGGREQQTEDDIITTSLNWTDGRVTGISDAESNWYRITYESGKVDNIVMPDEETLSISRTTGADIQAEVTTLVPVEGETDLQEFGTEIYEMDAQGRVCSYTEKSGRVTISTYNAQGLLASVETSGEYEYLDGDEIRVSPCSSVCTYEYNEDGNIVNESDDGIVTFYEYGFDINRNIITKAITVESDSIMANAFDLEEQSIFYSSPDIISEIRYTYDLSERLIEENNTLTKNRTVYEYGTFGNNSEQNSEYLFETGLSCTCTRFNDDIVLSASEEKLDEDKKIYYKNETIGEQYYQADLVYDGNGRLISETDDMGNIVLHSYDTFGREISRLVRKEGSDELLSYWSATYGANSEILTEETDGKLNIYHYDCRNRVNSSEYHSGLHYGLTGCCDVKSFEISYEREVEESPLLFSSGVLRLLRKKMIIDNTNATVEWADSIGNVVKVSDNDFVTEYEQDVSGNIYITAISDTTGIYRVDAELYDDLSRKTEQIDNIEYQNGTWHLSYDSSVTSLGYDVRGNLTEKTIWSSDECETDREIISTQYYYDDAGRIIEKNEGDNSILYNYEFDDAGNIRIVTEYENGGKFEEIVNPNGLVLLEKKSSIFQNEEVSVIKRYEYDDKGRLLKEWFPSTENGEEETYGCIVYQYNDLGDSYQIITISYNNEDDVSIEQRTIRTFNLKDQILSETDEYMSGEAFIPLKCTDYEYNSEGRLITEANKYFGNTQDDIIENRVEYLYTQDGKLSEMVYPNHPVGLCSVHFTYNNEGFPQNMMGLFEENNDLVNLASFSYDCFGRMTEESIIKDPFASIPEYETVLLEYDTYDRLISLNYVESARDVVLESHCYDYDNFSRIIRENILMKQPSDTILVQQERSYAYDSKSRLLESQIVDYTGSTTTLQYQYEYDLVGNHVKTEEHVYDESHREISDCITEFEYNGLNQLVSSRMEKSEEGVSSEANSSSYTYNTKGEMTDVIDNTSGTERRYEYDARSRLLTVQQKETEADVFQMVSRCRYDENNLRISREGQLDSSTYLYQNGIQKGIINSSGECAWRIDDPFGKPLLLISESNNMLKSVYYHTDVRGSVTSIHDASGNVEEWYSYSDFGETTLHKTDTSTNVNNIFFISGIYDNDTGLYYLNARYYSPETSVFLTMEQYREEKLSDRDYLLYRYCANNPISNTDPSGYYIETVIDIVSLGMSVQEFAAAPSWVTAGSLVWDLGAMFLPFIPGSWSKKAGTCVIKVADKASDFNKQRNFTIGQYKHLKKIFKGKGYECHHIIEKRFSRAFSIHVNEYPSVELSKELHKEITRRWKEAIPRRKIGESKSAYYKRFTKKKLKKAVKTVYHDMPKLKKAALDMLDDFYTNPCI